MGATSAPWADGLEHINVRLFLDILYLFNYFYVIYVPSPLQGRPHSP